MILFSMFSRTLENPAEARDIDIVCGGVSGWKLFELAAHLENTLHINFDRLILNPYPRPYEHR
jgi:uncharacterized protein